MNWHGKPKYSEKTCPSATLSTTNPTWRDPGLDLGRRVGQSTTRGMTPPYLHFTSAVRDGHDTGTLPRRPTPRKNTKHVIFCRI
jgi:hypothetical protein